MTDQQRFASVWDAIEDTPQQAVNMKLRATLMSALKDRIAQSGISQAQAAELFGVTQPRACPTWCGARSISLAWMPWSIWPPPLACKSSFASSKLPDPWAWLKLKGRLLFVRVVPTRPLLPIAWANAAQA